MLKNTNISNMNIIEAKVFYLVKYCHVHVLRRIHEIVTLLTLKEEGTFNSEMTQ